MPPRRRTPKATPAKLAKRMSRRWRVVLLRAKGGLLQGLSRRQTRTAARRSPAAAQFELDDVRRNRIIVQELA